MSMTDRLYDKYTVRSTGSGKYAVTRNDGKPDNGRRYFVLSPDTDPAARVALIAYADAVEREHPGLSAGLREAYDLPTREARHADH